jgi:hypothetical protein
MADVRFADSQYHKCPVQMIAHLLSQPFAGTRHSRFASAFAGEPTMSERVNQLSPRWQMMLALGTLYFV